MAFATNTQMPISPPPVSKAARTSTVASRLRLPEITKQESAITKTEKRVGGRFMPYTLAQRMIEGKGKLYLVPYRTIASGSDCSTNSKGTSPIVGVRECDHGPEKVTVMRPVSESPVGSKSARRG